jgi:hypothetical protein
MMWGVIFFMACWSIYVVPLLGIAFLIYDRWKKGNEEEIENNKPVA